MSKLGNAIIALGITAILGWCMIFLIKNPRKHVTEKAPESVKCPTCYECNVAREIYAKYMDSLNYGLRKNRSRYEDSTRKYGAILRQQ